MVDRAAPPRRGQPLYAWPPPVTLEIATFDSHERLLAHYVPRQFGDKAVGSITLADCEDFRADLAARLGNSSVRNIWQAFSAVLRYCQRANAIQINPELIDHPRGSHGGPAPMCGIVR